MKKITDRYYLNFHNTTKIYIYSFELGDDTFFRAVFLYDYQDRFIHKESTNGYKLSHGLDEYFIFGDTEDEKTRKWKYIKFFEAL